MYTNGKFTKTESKKLSTQLEILGIIKTLYSFHMYIKNNEFTTQTNCRNIIEYYNKF